MKTAKHFLLEEHVCPHTLKRDGKDAWRYVQPIVIDFADWLREELGVPCYINNYKWGGPQSQRGHRCNLCYEVKKWTKKNVLYVSAHILGLGIDINAKGYTADELRDWIKENIHRFFKKFPQYIPKCRIESREYAPTWCHIDFYQHYDKSIVRIIEPIRQL